MAVRCVTGGSEMGDRMTGGSEMGDSQDDRWQ